MIASPALLAALALLAPLAQDTGTHGVTEETDDARVVGADERTDWAAQGREALARRLAVERRDGPARNVILFVGDGMDVTTTTAARILAGQRAGGTGEEHVLAFETLPHTALSKTYTVDTQTADSAGTATAMLSGHKTRSGVINVDQTVERGDCEGAAGARLPTLADLAARSGRSVGVVTTARLTHATPAALYASSPDRDWESDDDLPAGTSCRDIASQLVGRAGLLSLEVALGGGRRAFLPREAVDPEHEDRTGQRADGRDLTEEWAQAGGTYVWDQAGFDGLDRTDGAPVLGLFEPSHMAYEADRTAEGADEPSLAEMTRFAIERLSDDEDGYFLLVEGGRIDHAHHAGNAARALVDTIAFDDAVRVAMDSADSGDTLLIVTADHGHTLTFGGYPARGNDVLGIVRPAGDGPQPPELASDGKPYTTLGYANGPGALAPALAGEGRPPVTDEIAQMLDYRQQSAIPYPFETHGGQDVAVYARGPGAWAIGGVLEQNVLFYVMERALDVTDCDGSAPDTCGKP